MMEQPIYQKRKKMFAVGKQCGVISKKLYLNLELEIEIIVKNDKQNRFKHRALTIRLAIK